MVGVPGSGKSTLGRQLAGRLAVPYVELDAIFHQPEWTPLPEEQFRRRVAAIASGDGWVIDGNYSTVRPLVWGHADTVVWLDPPRRTVMRRLIWRSIRRAAGRTELWNGNRERWRNLFTWDEQESIIAPPRVRPDAAAGVVLHLGVHARLHPAGRADDHPDAGGVLPDPARAAAQLQDRRARRHGGVHDFRFTERRQERVEIDRAPVGGDVPRAGAPRRVHSSHSARSMPD
jgi:adenylate kinase family enzyme